MTDEKEKATSENAKKATNQKRIFKKLRADWTQGVHFCQVYFTFYQTTPVKPIRNTLFP